MNLNLKEQSKLKELQRNDNFYSIFFVFLVGYSLWDIRRTNEMKRKHHAIKIVYGCIDKSGKKNQENENQENENQETKIRKQKSGNRNQENMKLGIIKIWKTKNKEYIYQNLWQLLVENKWI